MAASFYKESGKAQQNRQCNNTLDIMKTYITLIILGLAVAVGCDMTGPHKTGTSQTTAIKAVSTRGQVVYRDKDGGFYGILTDNGGQYEPSNLAAQYKSDGLHVVFTGQLDTMRLGSHRWGNPVEIASIGLQK